MGNTTTRYKLEMSEEDANALLLESYRVVVAKRGSSLVEDTDTTDKVRKAARWMTSGSKPGLLLYGRVGNGKTTLVRAMSELVRLAHYSALSSEAKHVRFITATDLAKMAKDRPGDFEKTIRVEMLAIDDIGTEPETVKHYGNVITPITEAIFCRYDAQLFTLCTSNLDMEGMRTRYDERFYDRMIEMFNRVGYNNGSYRK